MASPSTVITLGMGSFGGASLLLTLGYGIGSVATLVYGPISVQSATLYLPGSQQADVATFGAAESGVYVPGAG